MPTPVAPSKTFLRLHAISRVKAKVSTPTRSGGGATTVINYMTFEVDDLIIDEFGRIVGTVGL